MLVIAFDGVLFDSLEVRAMVLADALSAEKFSVADDSVRTAIAGRSFSEAVRFLVSAAHDSANIASISESSWDATSLDIATIRADQSYAALAARGLSLNTHTRDLLQRAASVTRIALRADSRRRETDALLASAGLDTAVSMIRCSDDPAPRAVRPTINDFSSTVRNSYNAIVQRLWQNSTLLGARGPVGVALESGALATNAARELGFEIAQSVSALNFPAR